MKKVYFDEAGNTYGNLLDIEQPFYGYIGICDKNNDLIRRFSEIKAKHHYKIDQENKGKTLVKSKPGRNFLIDLWKEFGKDSKVVFHDKKYALACKMFEYVFEPVFSDVNTLFYQINFHRYISFIMYNCFIESDLSAEQLFLNFYQFIKNGGDLPLVDYVNSCSIAIDSPMHFFAQFCNEHKNEIASDIDFNNGDNKYLLDLTLTSIHGLLCTFSNGSLEGIEAHCDDVKSLRENLDFFMPYVNCKRIVYTDLFNNHAQINYNLSQLPILENSKNIIEIQIADLLVSSLFYAYLHKDDEFSKNIFTLSANSFVTDRSIQPLELHMSFDEYEIDEFNKIIKLLAMHKSKVEKIKKLKEISFNLQKYQIYREQYLIDFIKKYKKEASIINIPHIDK